MGTRTSGARRTVAAVLAGAGIGALALAGAPAALADDGGGRTLLKASVAGSLPTDAPVAGVVAGGAPWVIDKGTARLRADGRLDVRVEGLVIPGVGNPVTELAASVVCGGMVVATTATVPYSSAGDARIDAVVVLPDRCVAPVVLLNPRGNAGVYIGLTGSEA